MGEAVKRPAMGHYDANYGNFQTELYGEIRRQAVTRWRWKRLMLAAYS